MTPSDICIVTVRDEPGVRFGNPLPAIYDFESEINAPEIPAPTEVRYERGKGHSGQLYITNGRGEKVMIGDFNYNPIQLKKAMG